MHHATVGQGTGYRWLLTALIAVFLTALVGSIIYAARKVSRVTDPDYYSHGLDHDLHRAGPKASDWQVQATFSRGGLHVVIVDHTGKPVLVESVRFIPDAGNGRAVPVPVRLTRQDDGTFQLLLGERNVAGRGTIVATGRAGTISRKVVILP
jgi:hypothetical protein